jgi:hypothetical protein
MTVRAEVDDLLARAIAQTVAEMTTDRSVTCGATDGVGTCNLYPHPDSELHREWGDGELRAEWYEPVELPRLRDREDWS